MDSSAFSSKDDPFQTYFFPTEGYDETFAIYASPSTYVREGLPPLLIVHHECDPLVPIAQTDAFVRSARRAGASIVFRKDRRPLDDPHMIVSEELFAEALQFFSEKLRG